MKVPNIGILMFAAIVILGVFNATEADARLDFYWLEAGGAAIWLELSDHPYILTNSDEGASYFLFDFADPANPRNAEIFDIPNFSSIISFEIDDRSYVAVTHWSDDSAIYIIDVTSIYRPNVVWQAAYDDNDPIGKHGPGLSIETVFEKDGKPYAILIVSSGIVIADISNIENPRQVSLITNSYLEGSRGAGVAGEMNVVELQGRTYMIAPSQQPDGATAIDITDLNNPTPVKSPMFYVAGENAFADAFMIKILDEDDKTYAVVTTHIGYMHILDITNPASTQLLSTTVVPYVPNFVVHDIGNSTYTVVVGGNSGVIVNITDVRNPDTVAELDTNTATYGGMLGVFDTNGKTYVVTAPDVRGSPGLLDTFDITDPSNPTDVVQTLGDGFYATRDTKDVTVAEIGNKTYSFSAGHDLEGAIQIIDITSPGHAEPVHAIFHTMKGFEGIYRAWGIDVAHMDDRVYAIVASEYDGGSVQVIDVTAPQVPQPVSLVTDEQGGFTHLGDPWDVAVAEINGRHYAVTASRGDNAVQIIDITNPAAPRPTGHVDTHLWPYQIKITELEDKVHAVVATTRDSSVQVIDISDPHRPVITDSSSVDDALSLDITELNGRTYAVVAGRADGGGGGHMTIKDVTNPDSIRSVSKLVIPWGDANRILGQGFGYGAGVDGEHAFFVGGSGIRYIDISNPSSPEIVSEKLNSRSSRAVVHVVDDVPYALTFSVHGMKIQAYDYPGKIYHIDGLHFVPAITNPLDAVTAVFDGHNGFEALAGVNSIAAIKSGNCSYALAGGSDGIQIINMSDPFRPAPVNSIVGMVVLDMELVETIDGKRLVVETVDGIVAFDVTNPAMPVQVAVNTGLTEISSDDGRILGAQIIYLSGESTVVSSHQGIMRVVDGYTINTQRLEALLDVQGATAAALAEIGGVVYGLVTVTDNPEPGFGNMLIYDVSDPHNPVELLDILDNRFIDFVRVPKYIETFEVADKTFAITYGTIYDGHAIRINDITDPLDRRLHDAGGAGDDGNNIRALAGASDFDVIVIDGRLYGLVAATEDNGVQVMDITRLVER